MSASLLPRNNTQWGRMMVRAIRIIDGLSGEIIDGDRRTCRGSSTGGLFSVGRLPTGGIHCRCWNDGALNARSRLLPRRAVRNRSGFPRLLASTSCSSAGKLLARHGTTHGFADRVVLVRGPVAFLTAGVADGGSWLEGEEDSPRGNRIVPFPLISIGGTGTPPRDRPALPSAHVKRLRSRPKHGRRRYRQLAAAKRRASPILWPP